jgi:hypothetical protein
VLTDGVVDSVAVSDFHLLLLDLNGEGVPPSKPRDGRASPDGGENLNGFPEGVMIESVIGLNSMDPVKVIAVVNSGLVRKFMVPGFPSFLALLSILVLDDDT